MVALLLALLLSEPVTGQGVTLGEIKAFAADPVVAEMARRLLPPEVAGRVVEVQRAGEHLRLPNTDDFTFYEGSSAYSPGVCSRLAHYVAVGVSGPGPHPDTALLTKHQVATYRQFAFAAPGEATGVACRPYTGWVQSVANREDSTLLMARRLVEAVEAAKAPGPLPFKLVCETTQTPTPCSTARRELADLPMERLCCIQLESGRSRVVSSTPGTPGAPSVVVRQALAPETGRYPAATLTVGGGLDGGRWDVRVEGVERLEAVELRRRVP